MHMEETMRQVSALAPHAKGPTITAGEILVEIMATTVGDGFLEPQTLIGPFPSGAPAIFIDQVARCGGSAGIIAAVGDDDFGRLNIERLRRDGVDISAIATVADRPTGSAFVRYRENGARDFVFNIAHSAARETHMTDKAQALIEQAGHAHVMGSAFAIAGIGEIILEAIKSVKARGGSVSFDPNIRKELVQGNEGRKLIDDLLDVTDLLLPSGEELQAASGLDDEDAAIEKLLASGIGEIVLKRGAQGASHFSRAYGRIDAPGLTVSEIDPTGAGDCFGATYLTCRRLGMHPERALAYANASGAHNVIKRGPMEGAASLAELDAFMTALLSEEVL
ncbi:sugar kinase [Agrobacterium tumefaciens]|uniref:Sugar kinase n=1 Tax=Agrobacterium tumefaciens TaxID=358 RepID=A0AA44JFC6_AGRTU|nr:sugar kinase [Agrobacterium tumefaciens]NSL19937.1 sugar kinase [Agrobacterium tumefaciens]NTB88609.1 sugar kinase [Agrobacterium tumefaciens]NTC17075.1 sugar kinase [Agrobacterium tumefaciens]NTC32413.1 sugar kinase [Agrobacterium tumefaciens]NTC54918.1 sugar kinase [Agrobacterium tumefaciens]